MYFKTNYEREYCKRMVEGVGNWIAAENYTLFGTATYIDAMNVRTQKAHKDAPHFARLLSRRVLGKHKVDREGTYLPMMTFIERGKNRDKTHIHFFIKGYTLKQTKGIIYHSNRIWQSKIDCSLDLVIKDELEAQRRTYTMKEQLSYDDEILCPNACYIPKFSI
jgi:hypothetical protein